MQIQITREIQPPSLFSITLKNSVPAPVFADTLARHSCIFFKPSLSCSTLWKALLWDTLVTQCSGTPFVGLVKHLYWTRLFKPLLKHEDMSYAPKRIICGVFAFSTLKKRGCLGKCVLKPYVSFGSLQPLLTWRVGSTIERTLSLCRLFKKTRIFPQPTDVFWTALSSLQQTKYII